MLRSIESNPVFRRIDYKEMGQSILTALISAPTVALLEQTLNVYAPSDTKLLVAGAYYALATGMTYMGLIHMNRALRNV